MDCMPTPLLAAQRDEGRARIEFCTVSVHRQLETELITDGNGHTEDSAENASADASARCYAGDFFSPLLVAARHHASRRS